MESKEKRHLAVILPKMPEKVCTFMVLTINLIFIISIFSEVRDLESFDHRTPSDVPR